MFSKRKKKKSNWLFPDSAFVMCATVLTSVHNKHFEKYNLRKNGEEIQKWEFTCCLT